MKYPHSKRSVPRGSYRGQFRHLDKKDQAELMHLVAVMSERAYRRGVQQGAYLHAEGRVGHGNDLWDWRYGVSLEKRPDVEAPCATSWVESEELNYCLDMFTRDALPESAGIRYKPVGKSHYRHLPKKTA